jgi:hypothetical protein
MKKIKIAVTDQDQKCLMMLWRWKLLSTSSLHLAVYPERTPYRCYRRLLLLEENELIVSTSSWDRKSVVWHLGKIGFEFVKNQVSMDEQVGFRSENKDHDFWVTAIHLGEWLTNTPKGCANFTEQELRRTGMDNYPDWVPQTKQHRPDGYWKIGLNKSNAEGLIALEVELSKKTPMAYSDVGDFYSNMISLYQVIWVVRSEGDIAYIHRHLKTGSSSHASEQSFITLNQYTEHQWQSKILTGKNQGKTLSELLNTSGELLENQGSAKVLLDVRKKPMNTISPDRKIKIDLGLSRQY